MDDMDDMEIVREKSRKLVVLFLALGCLAGGCSDASKTSIDASSLKRDAGAGNPDAAALTADGLAPAGDMGKPDEVAATPDASSAKQDVATVQADSTAEVIQNDGGANDGIMLACSAPENTAPVIGEIVVPDPPPVAHGGVIEPGLYYETSFVRYNGAANPPDSGILTSHHLTATIDDMGGMEFSTTLQETGRPDNYVVQIRPDGTNSVTFNYLCPFITDIPIYRYDATPESVVFYREDSFGPYGYTLTKQ